jgi:predicted CoA-binding protein
MAGGQMQPPQPLRPVVALVGRGEEHPAVAAFLRQGGFSVISVPNPLHAGEVLGEPPLDAAAHAPPPARAVDVATRVCHV